MSKTLLIRADANTRMGTGHVMRCIALGQAWQDAGGKVVFATCCDNAEILQRLRDENFKVIELNDSDEFLSRLSTDLRPLASGLWLVLDGYHFDLKYQQAIRRAGFKLLCVDDYNHLPEYECDILLNQNITAFGFDYSTNSDAQFLLGTNYVLLRREFFTTPVLDGIREGLERHGFPEIGRNVLVTLGGADPHNITERVIKAFQQLDMPELCAKIIIGPINPHREILKRAVSEGSLNIEILNSIDDMTPLMLWADVAVSATGSSCWEFMYMGIPFISLVLAENQRKVSFALVDRKLTLGLGDGNSVTSSQIAKSLFHLLQHPGERNRLSVAGQTLIDGLGAGRVVANF